MNSSDNWSCALADATLVDLLRRRAIELPNRKIYTLLDDGFFDTGVVGEESLTYGQLDQLSRSIAVQLQRWGAPGDRIALLYGPGLEFMPALFGCLFAGMIPVPVNPPVRGMELDPLAGVRRVVQDCEPIALLSGGQMGQDVKLLCETEPLLANRRWLDTSQLDISRADQWQRPSIDCDTIALLQYTSGSTGSPRGVLVTHGNILNNQAIIQQAVNHRTDVRPGVGVCWLPFHHDMGLIGSVLQSVFVDGPCYFMSPVQFLRKPVRWLQAISHLAPQTPYISGGPNFAYELCVRKVKEEEKAKLDLSKWEVAYIGAETVSAATLERFAECFAPCGFKPAAFYPGYGLAEATLVVTGKDFSQLPVVCEFVERHGEMTLVADQDPSKLAESTVLGPRDEAEAAQTTLKLPGRRLVGSGRPCSPTEVLIVDPVTCVKCPQGTVGEIWVSGPCVARGYSNRPLETEQVFQAYTQPDQQGPFLRTGDLGFLWEAFDRRSDQRPWTFDRRSEQRPWTFDRRSDQRPWTFDRRSDQRPWVELFVTGRLKDLIIIRGKNFFPDDIECTVRRLHESFKAATTVALGHAIDGEERLVILQEIDRSSRRIDTGELTSSIRQAIAEEHQLNTHDICFLQRGTLPKTTSGKVQRSAARQLYAAGHLLEWKGANSQ